MTQINLQLLANSQKCSQKEITQHFLCKGNIQNQVVSPLLVNLINTLNFLFSERKAQQSVIDFQRQLIH